MNLQQKAKKNTTKEYRYFLESNFFVVKRLFALAYSNQDDNAKILLKNTIYRKTYSKLI